MRMIFALIGYLCVATVLSAAMGLGYLWNTQRLTDEKVFRIVAMIHGVNIDSAADEMTIETTEEEAPPEEPSLDEKERMREIALRNVEVKLNALQRGRDEFDHMFRNLTEARERIDDIASELEKRIEEETELAAQEGVSDVVDNLVSIKPDEAKVQLLKILESGGSDPDSEQAAMDTVIRLLKSIPQTKRTPILKKFTSDEEVEQLHEIHEQMLRGGPKKRNLDEVMRQLKQRDFS